MHMVVSIVYLRKHPNSLDVFVESIDELIKAYSYELRGGDHGDAHLLPERLATCRQVHPDDSANEIGSVNQFSKTKII